MPKKFSTEKRAQIIGALQKNPNASAVARTFGCSVPGVTKIANDEGINLTAGKAKSGRLSSEIHARIFAELEARPTVTEVARKIGCSRTTVGKAAKDARTDVTITDHLPPRVNRIRPKGLSHYTKT